MGEGRGIYSVAMFHVVADCISFATTFFIKVIAPSFRRSSAPNRARFAGLRFGLPPCGRPCFRISASFSSTHAKKKDTDLRRVFLFGFRRPKACSTLR